MATTSSALRQLSDGNSIGTSLGTSTSDVISFYGTTAVNCFQLSTATMVSVSSGALASSIAIALIRLGLINGSTFAA